MSDNQLLAIKRKMMHPDMYIWLDLITQKIVIK